MSEKGVRHLCNLRQRRRESAGIFLLILFHYFSWTTDPGLIKGIFNISTRAGDQEGTPWFWSISGKWKNFSDSKKKKKRNTFWLWEKNWASKTEKRNWTNWIKKRSTNQWRRANHVTGVILMEVSKRFLIHR